MRKAGHPRYTGVPKSGSCHRTCVIRSERLTTLAFCAEVQPSGTSPARGFDRTILRSLNQEFKPLTRDFFWSEAPFTPAARQTLSRAMVHFELIANRSVAA